MEKGHILPFPKKGGLGIAKNYWVTTLTSIKAKIYKALLLNRIKPEIEKVFRQNQNGFRRNRSTTSPILRIRRFLESVRAKNLEVTLLFVDSFKAFDSVHRGNIFIYGLPKETVAAIMMLYKNTKVKVHSPDGNTDFLDIVAGVLQGGTLAPYQFLTSQDYVLRTSINLRKENGLTMEKHEPDVTPHKLFRTLMT